MILYDKDKMNDVSVIGGKAAGLAKLTSYGCRIPDFFVITAGTSLNDEFAAELLTFAAHLHCDTFSVRSSSVTEDSASNSFAGQYATLLNVRKENLFAAVKEVAQSISGRRADKYASHFDISQCEMAIIVQKQITGIQSGVVFTQSPLSTDEMIIESVNGAGEALVSGTVTPCKTVIKKGERSGDGYLSELARTALKLEESEGYPLDIEWTFADKLYFLQMRPMTGLGDRLPNIPDRKWNLYVYRDFCLLAHSVQRRAVERDIQNRLFGFSVPIYECLLVNGREFYSEENDDKTLKVWSKLDRNNFFEDYISAIKKHVASTKRRATALKNKSFAGCSNADLYAAYGRAMDAYIESYVPLMMRPDDYLLFKYQSIYGELTRNIAEIITPVWKKTAYSDEKVDFLRIKINGKTDSYVEKYEWVNNPLGKRVVRLTDKDMEKRLQRLTIRQAKEKLAALIHGRAQKMLRFEQYLNGTDEPLRRLLRLISEFIYLRTYTAENSDRLFYYIRERLIFEIADRLKIPHEEILCMTFDEIRVLQHGKRIEKSDFAKRRSGELITFFDGESRAYYGNIVNTIARKLLPHVKDGDIITGEVACAGEVRGEIKIVRNFSEADNVKEGDIVVTSMTTPEIVAALEKAGGIITDEGGITCHAAIIAREYGIPCLVGTKNATSILNDGMKVFLDCLNGRAEILLDEN